MKPNDTTPASNAQPYFCRTYGDLPDTSLLPTVGWDEPPFTPPASSAPPAFITPPRVASDTSMPMPVVVPPPPRIDPADPPTPLWDQPVDDGTAEALDLPYQKFPLDALPPVVADYAANCMATTMCSCGFIVPGLLASLATAIGNSRRIRFSDGWIEPAAVWILAVAPVSAGKTPGLNAAIAPLQRIDGRLTHQHMLARKTWTEKQRRWKAATPTEKKDPALDPGPEPAWRQLLVDDITVEALAVAAADNPRGLGAFVDEAGNWFGSHGRYKQGAQASDQTAWHAYWSGQPYKANRKNIDCPRIAVPRPFCTLSGGIQPAVLAEALNPRAHACGMAARFLLTSPPPRPTGHSQQEPDTRLAYGVQDLLQRLLDLPMHEPADRPPEPVNIPVSREAFDLHNAFMLDNKAFCQDQGGHLLEQQGKLDSYAARFALILHTCNAVTLPAPHPGHVTAEEMTAAIKIVVWFRSEAVRTYALLEVEKSFNPRGIQMLTPAARAWKRHQHTKTVLDKARKQGGEISLREVQRLAPRGLYHDCQEIYVFMMGLEKEGHGRVETVTQGNRLTYVLRLTP